MLDVKFQCLFVSDCAGSSNGKTHVPMHFYSKQLHATLGQICVWIVDNLKQTDLQSVAFTVDCNRGFQTRTYNDNN